MKALSIKQPWAGLIIAGIKTVENRTWGTLYRGTLVIVSTQKPDKIAMESMRMRLGTLPATCDINGAILGTAELTGHILYLEEDDEIGTDHPGLTESNYEWWDDYCMGWVLESPHPLSSPIPYKGRLGLYPLPDDVIAEIVKRIKR